MTKNELILTIPNEFISKINLGNQFNISIIIRKTKKNNIPCIVILPWKINDENYDNFTRKYVRLKKRKIPWLETKIKNNEILINKNAYISAINSFDKKSYYYDSDINGLVIYHSDIFNKYSAAIIDDKKPILKFIVKNNPKKDSRKTPEEINFKNNKELNKNYGDLEIREELKKWGAKLPF